MITREIINQTYIQNIVARDSSKIYDIQADVVFNNLTKRTGNLQNSVSVYKGEVNGTTFSFPILTYMRFLDIHYHKEMISERRNLALYNRVIWGVLYRETMPALRGGLTEKIRAGIRAQLLAATSQQEIPFPD